MTIVRNEGYVNSRLEVGGSVNKGFGDGKMIHTVDLSGPSSESSPEISVESYNNLLEAAGSTKPTIEFLFSNLPECGAEYAAEVFDSLEEDSRQAITEALLSYATADEVTRISRRRDMLNLLQRMVDSVE